MSAKQIANNLEVNTALLWVVDLAGVSKIALEDWQTFLSDDELDRGRRFHFERDRRSFLVSHGLLRTALTSVVPCVHPRDWIFARSPQGRPEIDQPVVVPRLRFNISHTTSTVACVVTTEVDCGVDVEAITPLPEFEALCGRILAPPEKRRIATMSVDERLSGFFRLWTLKEAYAKARGLGISLPFEQLAFSWCSDGIRLEIHPTLDDSEHWHFEQWRVSDNHILSVALRGGRESSQSVVCYTALPPVTL